MSKFKLGIILSCSLILTAMVILLIWSSVIMLSPLPDLNAEQAQAVILTYSLVVVLLSMEIVFYILPIISAVKDDPSIYLGIILLLFGGIIPGILYLNWYNFEATSPEVREHKKAERSLINYSVEYKLTKAAAANGKVIEKAKANEIRFFHK